MLGLTLVKTEAVQAAGTDCARSDNTPVAGALTFNCTGGAHTGGIIFPSSFILSGIASIPIANPLPNRSNVNINNLTTNISTVGYGLWLSSYSSAANNQFSNALIANFTANAGSLGSQIYTSGYGAVGVYMHSNGGYFLSNQNAVYSNGGGNASGLSFKSWNNGNGNRAYIQTTGNRAHGVYLLSRGGDGVGGDSGTFGGGDSGQPGGLGGHVFIDNRANVQTYGHGSHGLNAVSMGGNGGNGGGGGLAGGGGAGGQGGQARSATITNYGNVTTHGNSSHGLISQSLAGRGGGGGDGLFWNSGGNGGATSHGDLARANNYGVVRANGQNSYGIFGQSVGGFGGSGGDSNGFVGFGGGGNTAGNGGTVLINNYSPGSVTTIGNFGHAIFGQSIGGGGGAGGDGAGFVGIGGGGSSGGSGGGVGILNSGTVVSYGNFAHGIFGQSVGGGGGDGGDSAGYAAIGGNGAATSNGGNVNIINTGTVHANAYGAHAILAQSIGGGGGNGGSTTALSVGIGGKGGGGGNAGNVTVDNSGRLTTNQNNASALVAQSIGGGGGNGGDSFAAGGFALTLGGSGGNGGSAGNVTVTGGQSADPNFDIRTYGARSHGILAQSIGGGGGNGGYAGSLGGSVLGSFAMAFGGAGGNGGYGLNAKVDTSNRIQTYGAESHAIFAQSIGGGGGNGGYAIAAAGGTSFSASAAFGGSGGHGGGGSIVDVLSRGTLYTQGARSSGIMAQSVGGGGGDGGFAVSGSVAGNASFTFAMGGTGGNGGIASSVHVRNEGAITTIGNNSHAIVAQSIGGGGGNGGFAVGASLGGQGSMTATLGGNGGGGGDSIPVIGIAPYYSNAVRVLNYNVLNTYGHDAHGILAQSIGGGGGNGGFSIGAAGAGKMAANLTVGGKGATGGNGAKVDVNNYSAITTRGNNAKGILAQSVGGGGGNGGFAVGLSGASSGSAGANLGGFGGGGGNSGVVEVENSGGTITTLGKDSSALVAQSIGGGGGNGGFTYGGTFSQYNASLNVGGGAAAGGNGNSISIYNTGFLDTYGDDSYGILGQSIGGGGGNGGFSAGTSFSTGFSGTLAVGGVTTRGGHASLVNIINHGNIATRGIRSSGILAQSIGGGGGNGGFSAAGGFSTGNAVSASVGGRGGGGGNAAYVSVTNSGSIITEGSGSYGIHGQSIGGGGGNGGFSLGSSGARGHSGNLTVGGTGGGGGDAGFVLISNTGTLVATKADNAHAVVAQSIGGGGGNGGFALAGNLAGQNAITASIGGKGSSAGNSVGARVTSTGNILTEGHSAYGILAQGLGGGGGNGGFAFAGGAAVNANSVSVGIGGQGGSGGHVTGDVSAKSNGAIHTKGNSAHAIVAQSIGGGGGNGGFSGTLSGTLRNGAKIGLALGGSGSVGGYSGKVTVETTGSILTEDIGAFGTLAQSIGGGGGNGGFGFNAALSPGTGKMTGSVSLGGSGYGGGDAGVVTITNGALITTTERYSMGILAQSIGGGGGNGGAVYQGNISARSSAKQFALGLGGTGGGGGLGRDVTINSTGTILTQEADAHGILAQSIGGGGGNGGMAIGANLTGSESTSFEMKMGGNGGGGNRGGNVYVQQDGLIETRGNRSIGIFGQSIGGGGGNGGITGAVSLGRSGSNSGYSIAIGGNGGNGNFGGNVTLINNGGVLTNGLNAHGVFAQSIGGGGGHGGDSLAATRTGSTHRNLAYAVALGGTGGNGNHAGNIVVTSNNTIVTMKDNSYGLYAQSIGGGGGDGGDANAFTIIGTSTAGAKDNSQNKSRILSIGGSGGASGNGGTVLITNNNAITTLGADSHAILAQSIGGGGGNGGGAEHSAPGLSDLIDLPQGPSLPHVPGFSFTPDVDVTTEEEPELNTDTKNLTATIGGSGGASGDGKKITINNTGTLRTFGDGAFGILAQSIGGGGGIGGIGASGETGTIGVGGAGGAAGHGGQIDVTFTGDLFTEGLGAHGIFVQSIGGGGGIGGNVDRAISEDNTTGLAFNRSGGGGGNGGAINIATTGNIVTKGDAAFGIFAQSIGGGGGVVGSATTGGTGFAGTTGAVGQGGDILINHQGNIQTFGKNAHGIFAQSLDGTGAPSGKVDIVYDGTISVFGEGANAIYANAKEGCGVECNINVTLQNGAVLTGGLTDAAVLLSNGRQNVLTNNGVIQSLGGVAGTAVKGTSGADNVVNAQTLFGNVDLGAGVNGFTNNNGASFVPGQVMNIGGVLANAGVMNIGNFANIIQTALTGNLQQTAQGNSVFDIDLNNFTGDKIDVSGTAQINGQIDVNLLNIGLVKPGVRTADLIDTIGGLVDDGAVLNIAPSRIVKYDLLTGGGQKAVLRSNVDFTPDGIQLNQNQSQIGDYFNSILQQSSQEFKNATEVIMGLQTDEEVAAFYQQLTPEAQMQVKATGILSASLFNQRLRSCHQYSGANKFIREGECWWSAIGYRHTDRDTTSSAVGYEANSYDIAGGMQIELSHNLHWGLGVSVERSLSKTKDGRSTQDGDGVMIGSIWKREYGDQMFLTGTLAGGLTYHNAGRNVQTGPATFAMAESNYRTGFISTEVDLSKTYQNGNKYFRPLVGGNASYSWSTAFREGGAGALNVVGQRSDDIAFNVRAGFEVGGEIQDYVVDCTEDCPVMRPYLRVSAVKYLTDKDTTLDARFEGSATSNTFRVTSPTYEDYIDLQTGLEILTIDNSVLRLDYGTKLGKDSQQHSIQTKLSLPF